MKQRKVANSIPGAIGAWVLIYKEAEKKQAPDVIKAIQPARNYQKAVRPHSLIINDNAAR